MVNRTSSCFNKVKVKNIGIINKVNKKIWIKRKEVKTMDLHYKI